MNDLNISDLISKEEFFFVGKRTTVCLLTLKNGFEIVASSACIDPQNFNKEKSEWNKKQYLIDIY